MFFARIPLYAIIWWRAHWGDSPSQKSKDMLGIIYPKVVLWESLYIFQSLKILPYPYSRTIADPLRNTSLIGFESTCRILPTRPLEFFQRGRILLSETSILVLSPGTIQNSFPLSLEEISLYMFPILGASR